MDFLEELRAYLKTIGISDEHQEKLSPLLDKGKGIFATLNETITTANSKLTDAISTRDKAKTKLSEVATALNLSTDNLTVESIKQVISSKDANIEEVKAGYEKTIKDLNELRAGEKEHLASKVTTLEADLKTSKMEFKLSEFANSFNPINEVAQKEIMRHLKTGADLQEDGNIVYLGEDGQVRRNKDALPVTVENKIAELKTEMSFYFATDKQNTGGGASGTGGNTPNSGESELAQRIKARAKR